MSVKKKFRNLLIKILGLATQGCTDGKQEAKKVRKERNIL